MADAGGNPRREAGPRATSAWRAAMILLLILGSVRIFYLIWHDPVIAYASNGDPQRLQNCYDLWLPTQIVDPLQPAHLAPEASYFPHDKGFEDWCYFSSVQLIDWPVIILHEWIAGAGAALDIRWIGTVRAGLLLLVTGWGVMTLWRRGHARLALWLAGVQAVVFTDPVLTLFGNGFYSQFGAALFTIAACIAALIHMTRKRGGWVSLAVVTSLILLAASARQQNHFIIVVFALVFIVRGAWPLHRGFWAAWAGIGLSLILAVHSLSAGSPEDIGRARLNNSNVYYSLFLKFSPDKLALVSSMALPARCLLPPPDWDQALTPSFREQVVARFNPPIDRYTAAIYVYCPESGTVSRWRHLVTLIEQPVIFPHALWELFATPRRLDQWINPHVGTIGGLNRAPLRVANDPLLFSIDDAVRWLAREARWVYGLGVALVFGLGIFWPWSRRASGIADIRDDLHGHARWLCLGLSLYSLVSSLLGDGMLALQNHNTLFFMFFPALVLLILIDAAALGGRIPRRPNRA